MIQELHIDDLLVNADWPKRTPDRLADLRRLAEKPTKVFCPTGPGGGVDPTCSPSGSSTSDIEAARQDWADNGTKSKAFKKWFGDWENDPKNSSKVVDEDGNPQESYGIKKVYHGAPVEFSVFDKEKLGVNGVAAGLGFYFSENIEIANTFADSQKGVVFESYLNIRNPYDFDFRISKTEMLGWENHAIADLGEHFNAKLYRQKVESAFEYHGKDGTLSGERAWGVLREEVNDWRVNKILARAGYDGVTHLAGDLYGSTLGDGTFRGEGYGRVWVAFESTQIKSATGNQGTFDPKNPDTTKYVGNDDADKFGNRVQGDRSAARRTDVDPS